MRQVGIACNVSRLRDLVYFCSCRKQVQAAPRRAAVSVASSHGRSLRRFAYQRSEGCTMDTPRCARPPYLQSTLAFHIANKFVSISCRDHKQGLQLHDDEDELTFRTGSIGQARTYADSTLCSILFLGRHELRGQLFDRIRHKIGQILDRCSYGFFSSTHQDGSALSPPIAGALCFEPVHTRLLWTHA